MTLGQVKMGAKTERKVIVKGTQPFKITGVQGGGGQVAITDASTESKPVHVLTVALNPTKPGEQRWTLRIETDLPGSSSVELQAQAEIVP